MEVRSIYLENDGHEGESIYGAADNLVFLKQAESGLPVKDVCRLGGFSEPTFYKWRAKYGGMAADEARRLKDLEVENARLKRLLVRLAMLMSMAACGRTTHQEGIQDDKCHGR